MRRFLKIVGILALFATALAYFSFRLLFFDPFESSLSDPEQVVPRDVDFFVRRSDLALDFDPFPVPEFFLGLRLKSEWKGLAGTELYRRWEQRLGLQARRQRIEEAVAQIPVLDLMDDLLGREVFVAGQYREDGSAALAMGLRGSFRVRFLADALGYGPLRNLAAEVQDYSFQDGVHRFTVRGQSLALFRRRDLVVIGNDAELVTRMRQTASGDAIGLDQSPIYRAVVLDDELEVGRPLDLACQVGDVCRRFGIRRLDPGPLAAPLPKVLSRAVVPEALGLAVARLQLGELIDLHLRASLRIDVVRGQASGLLSGSSGAVEDYHRFLGNVFPEHVFACGYLRLGLLSFLRGLEGALDQDSRELLSEFVRYLQRSAPRLRLNNLRELVDELGKHLGDELIFALEPQAPYHIPGTPDNEIVMPDKSAGPRTAVLFPVGNRSAAEDLVQRVVNAVCQDPDQSARCYTWSYPAIPGSPTFKEIDFSLVGTPSVAVGFVKLEDRDFLVLTVTGQFFDEIVQNRIHRDSGHETGLGTTLAFRRAADVATGFGQGFLWVENQGLRKALTDQVEVVAEDATRPDWETLRGQLWRETAQRRFPRHSGPLPQEARDRIDGEVDRELERRELRWRQEVLPAAIEERRRDLGVVNLLHWAALSFRVHESDLEIHARVATPARFR